MLTIIVGLQILLVIELGIMLGFLRKSSRARPVEDLIDPFYPAFPKELVLKARIDLRAAEERCGSTRADAYRQESGMEKPELTRDIKTYRAFVEAHVDYLTAQERLYRLIEGNIAVLNGKGIASVVKEHGDWLTERMLRDLKAVGEAVQTFDQGEHKNDR